MTKMAMNKFLNHIFIFLNIFFFSTSENLIDDWFSTNVSTVILILYILILINIDNESNYYYYFLSLVEFRKKNLSTTFQRFFLCLFVSNTWGIFYNNCILMIPLVVNGFYKSVELSLWSW